MQQLPAPEAVALKPVFRLHNKSALFGALSDAAIVAQSIVRFRPLLYGLQNTILSPTVNDRPP